MAEQDKFLAMEVLTEKQKAEAELAKKRKKRNYIVGFSALGVITVTLITVYALAANVWLKDVSSLPYVEYEYNAILNSDGENKETATITSFNRDVTLPKDFRIPAYVNGHEVTAIKANAFAGCNDIVNVEIPDTIVEIGDYAFAQCQNLETFKFSKNISKLGVDPFVNTAYENSLDADDIIGVGKLLYKVGANNIKPNSVLVENSDSVIPDKYKSSEYNIIDMSTWGDYEIWGDGIFANNSKIVYAEIPSNLSFLPNKIFYGSTNLENVLIKDNINTIADSAFEGCTNLDIKIEDNITSIGKNAFKNTNISSVILSDNVTNIGSGAFEGCDKITSFDWPSHLEVIPENVFKDCTSLTSFTYSDEAYGTINKIGAHAFEKTALTSFRVPMNVSILDEFTFNEVETLTKVSFFRGANYYDQHNVASLIGINTISDHAFYKCQLDTIALMDENGKQITNEMEMHLPYTLNKVSVNTSHSNTFSDNLEMVEINIPTSLLTTSEFMFENNINLKTVNFVPVREGASYVDNLTTINSGTFLNCSSLERLDLPSSVSAIESRAFEGCTSIKEIVLPIDNPEYTSISNHLFAHCSSLENLVLSESINAFHTGAFKECSSLNNIVIPYCKEPGNLLIEKNTFTLCANEKQNLNIFLNITREEADDNKYLAKDFNEEGELVDVWHDDSCDVYYKGMWEMVDGVPTIIKGGK